MKKLAHLRKKAMELRRKNMSLNEIVAHLKVPKTTIYYWIKNIPVIIVKKSYWIRKAVTAHKRIAKDKRQQAYDLGLSEFSILNREPLFHDFVVLYMAEGYKRDRNSVCFTNSNAIMIQVAKYYIDRFSANKVSVSVIIHEDQDVDQIKAFWSRLLKVNDRKIRILYKSNSGKMNRRKWCSVYGVVMIKANDTYFRSKLQAWMDCISKEWEKQLF